MPSKDDGLIINRLSVPEPDDSVDETLYGSFREQLERTGKHLRNFSIDFEMLEHYLGKSRPGHDLNSMNDMKILEVGSRFGFHLYEAAGAGASCSALDIVPGMSKIVNRVAKANDLDVTAVTGDACRMPFPDETFDGIYGFSTFEHIWDKDAAMGECIRVLKPGGTLLISEGNPLFPRSFIRYCIRNGFSSKWKYGGLKWLFRRGRIIEDYREGWKGRDEDVHSIFWWKRYLKRFPGLETATVTTRFRYRCKYGHMEKSICRLLWPFYPFLGGVLVVARKRKRDYSICP